MPDRLKPALLPAFSAALALLILLPVLAPGYVLHLDMVFVAHQTLLPWMQGIGAGLPRSVPQDAVVALLAGPIPGQVLQKTVLVVAFVLAGVGAGRLAGPGLARQVPAAAIYMWSAYAAGRLLMGHWGLLWAFGLLPWVILAAGRARRHGRWFPLVVLSGVAALVPTGGLIAALTGLPLALAFGSRLRSRTRALIAVLVVALNAPWWVPALRSPVAAVSDPLGLAVFGARADGVGGVLASVAAGGGVWNAQATLPSRGTWFALLGTVALLALAAVGWSTARRERPPETIWLSVLGVTGLVWAWLTGVAGDQAWMQQIVTAVPGAGLLRDGQKWTIWWVLLLSLCAPVGLARVSVRAECPVRIFLAGALAMLPLAMLPDLAVGGLGRLTAVQYPASWSALREQVETEPAAGDVVSLPWTPFRRYAWNRSQVVLDPMPRHLTRTVVWNDDLPVTVDGRLVKVAGDDPRAAQIGRVIEAGEPLSPALARLGVGWIVVQRDQPSVGREPNLTGARRVWQQEDLELWQVAEPVAPRVAADPLVVAVDLAALAILVGCAGAWVLTRSTGRHDC